METKTNERKAWQQLAGESNEAYARFLAFRDLGPTRTILLAYASLRPGATQSENEPALRVTRIWWENFRVYHWKDRAAAWDVSQMASAVPEAATTIVTLLGETARVCLAEVANGNIKPKDFAELKDMVVILGNLISPEVIRTTIDHAGNAVDSDESRGR